MNRIIKIDYPAPLGYEEFGYNELSGLLWKKDGNSAVTLYEYDDLNRLTNVYYNYTGSLENIVYQVALGAAYQELHQLRACLPALGNA